MTIKTITCHHAINHGAMLQAYALVTKLRLIGHDAEIIDYRPDYLQGVKLWERDKRFRRIGLGWAYALAKLPSRLLALKREKVFDEFYRRHLPTTVKFYSTIGQLRINPPRADAYIAGSDQIWNTTFRNGTDPAFYLDFGDSDTKRISYAASFATSQIELEKQAWVKENLKRFDSISVREASAVSILEQLGYTGQLVVDPVFLLDIPQWDEIADIPDCDNDYILVYDLMNDSAIASVAQRLAKLYGSKIYSVGPRPLRYVKCNFNYSGPSTFVGLISKARCVISNSFHGTAFSIIYRRPFFVIERKDGLNVRMRDILSRYGLLDRIVNVAVNDEQLISSIDYKSVESLLNKAIRISQSFLETAL